MLFLTDLIWNLDKVTKIGSNCSSHSIPNQLQLPATPLFEIPHGSTLLEAIANALITDALAKDILFHHSSGSSDALQLNI